MKQMNMALNKHISGEAGFEDLVQKIEDTVEAFST